MNDSPITKYLFKMTNDLFNLNNLPMRAFEEISFHDSIFKFYPTANVILNDSAGIIVDNIYFVEGLEFAIEYGNTEEGFYKNPYIWNNNHVASMEMSDFISGYIQFALTHAYFYKDKPKGRGWNDTISNIVKDILKSDFSYTTFTNIEETAGVQTHYQMQKMASTLITDLSNVAFSNNYSNSPFYTFFNNLGEFYFAPLGKLFDQKPVATYRFSDEAVLYEDTIQDAEIESFGLQITKELYNIRTHKDNLTGSSAIEDKLMKDFYYKIDNKHKLLINKANESADTPTNTIYLGLIDSSQPEFYKGLVNNLYTNFNTQYRMVLLTNFNPAVAAGKVINIDVNSPDIAKGKGTEHSGKWLVLSSEAYADYDGRPYTRLIVGKSGIPVDPTHPLKNDFLS